MAKPYGLANQMLCYIQFSQPEVVIHANLQNLVGKRQRMFLRMIGELGPWSTQLLV